jgi:ABC-type multidrug transport system ATPase subunit
MSNAHEAVAALVGVHKRYGRIEALRGLDLEVRRGELLALLGPNGAGKSTAIGLWLGLIQPDAGAVRLLGGSPLDVCNRRGIGVMMQDAALIPELRVRELIELAASYYPDPLATTDTLRLCRIEALARRPYAKLSGGQKRQVQFALATCGRPQLLFLDEPTVGLDVQARETQWNTLRELVAQGCSIVLTTHYLDEAQALADRVAVLSSGRLIASGTVDEIRSVVSRRHIRCATQLEVRTIRAWPEVLEASRDSRSVHITAADAESVVRRLLAVDPALRDLEVRQADLSQAFAELTKEAA